MSRMLKIGQSGKWSLDISLDFQGASWVLGFESANVPATPPAVCGFGFHFYLQYCSYVSRLIGDPPNIGAGPPDSLCKGKAWSGGPSAGDMI